MLLILIFVFQKFHQYCAQRIKFEMIICSYLLNQVAFVLKTTTHQKRKFSLPFLMGSTCSGFHPSW